MKFQTKRVLYAAFFPFCFILCLWLIRVLHWGLDMPGFLAGIFPREAKGLVGILTGVLIHSDFSHVFSNTLPLFILGWCLCYFYTSIAYRAFFLIWITSGFITWCIGREAWHVGASGLIYGLCFFLFFSGIFRKYIPLVAVSLLVAFLYGSMLWNMFPVAEIVKPDVSWEGHLSGAIAGTFWAVGFRKYEPQKPEEPEEEEDEEETLGNEEDNLLE